MLKATVSVFYSTTENAPSPMEWKRSFVTLLREVLQAHETAQ